MLKFGVRGALSLSGAMALAALLAACANTGATLESGTVAERRAAVRAAAGKEKAGVPVLTRALEDESFLVRRASVRALARMAAPAEPALKTALGNKDFLVRRTALLALSKRLGPEAAPFLETALKEDDANMRLLAARILVGISPRTKEIMRLLNLAQEDNDKIIRDVVRQATLIEASDRLKDKGVSGLAVALKDNDEGVRLIAVKLLAAIKPRTEEIVRLLKSAREDKSKLVGAAASDALWPFHKETVLLRDRKDWDHQVVVKQTIPLPRDGWRFRTDPRRDGHLEKWYAADFDDGNWAVIPIEQFWQKAGYEYEGVAWYRGTFNLPERPKHDAVEIRFQAVDETAWVWLNGEYVGQHDIGPGGWKTAFSLDVSQALRWGRNNQITVRVLNTKGAGGIWKPVKLEVLGR